MCSLLTHAVPGCPIRTHCPCTLRDSQTRTPCLLTPRYPPPHPSPEEGERNQLVISAQPLTSYVTFSILTYLSFLIHKMGVLALTSQGCGSHK